MKPIKNRKISTVIFSILILFVGIIVGWLAHVFLAGKAVASPVEIRADSSDFHFINPLLFISDKDTVASPEYKTLTDSLNSFVNHEIGNGDAEDISVYFRDLNSGHWTGVNESHKYSPASMLKIGTLIACLQKAESDPSFLNELVQTSVSSVDQNIGQFYPPKNPIILGKAYTVMQLITAMIVDSDNNAYNLLQSLVGVDNVSGLMKTLQIPEATTSDFMSPRLYSRFYRVLYNSTYLSPSVSEQTLKFLTQKGFPGGLDAGVPDNILVAQKFGERTQNDASGNVVDRQLHDCGIVYYEDYPYFLCVMTKGQDFTKLQPIISGISKTVWDYIDSSSKKTL